MVRTICLGSPGPVTVQNWKRGGTKVEGGTVMSGRGWETAKRSTSSWKALLLDQLSSLPAPLFSNILETTEALLTPSPSPSTFTLSPQQVCFYQAHGFLSPMPVELPMPIILSYTWAVTLPLAEHHLPNSQGKMSKWGSGSCNSSSFPSDVDTIPLVQEPHFKNHWPQKTKNMRHKWEKVWLPAVFYSRTSPQLICIRVY